MKVKHVFLACVALAWSTMVYSEPVLFADDFKGELKEGWTWVREHPEGWRTSPDGLEILVEPGNMWGGANDAKNVLVRPVPAVAGGAVRVSATVENHPTGLYEQIDLVWYYDDSHMVKIGLELVHGQLSLVMGREEDDKTRTLSIVPMKQNKLDLRLTVTGNEIHGEYRVSGAEEWQEGGKCDLPAMGGAKVSLQAYQGVAGVAHWARVNEFRIENLEW